MTRMNDVLFPTKRTKKKQFGKARLVSRRQEKDIVKKGGGSEKKGS